MINKLKDSANTWVHSKQHVNSLISFVVDLILGWLLIYQLDILKLSEIPSYSSMDSSGKFFVILCAVGIISYVAELVYTSVALLLRVFQKVFN